ncbi:hypothetical protein AKJ09_09720 [Labilithrix luteola]|uniref:Outer membrane protein beta-barrel domain-containing protein n=1 Tax=Labilithrix luteola TaxID=1391654 RepID=A0A0K1QBL1_9BACT|nr:hypothetical protein [Labilithrix luteola]AKV03057.1 hypothetical protein AKJ09_09720 [Labilithrix luteola]
MLASWAAATAFLVPSEARSQPATAVPAAPEPDGGAPTPTTATPPPGTEGEPAAPSIAQPESTTPISRTIQDFERAPPPPTNVVYLQYGVAFTAEVLSSAGAICSNTTVPCILGTGGGITIRAGWRGTGSLYIGGAYALSKQDPNKLLRLAILQQARAEGRYYLMTGRDTEPYLMLGLGVAGYGNEWSVDTYGPAASLGAGIEAQVTRRTVVGVAVGYRVLHFNSFTDTSGADREAGIAQFVGLDLVLEQRDPIFTERKR